MKRSSKKISGFGGGCTLSLFFFSGGGVYSVAGLEGGAVVDSVKNCALKLMKKVLEVFLYNTRTNHYSREKQNMYTYILFQTKE